MTQPPFEPVAGDDAPSLSVRCVRALMERHGVPKYRQSAWLAAKLGLSYAQAHRRMNGAAAWTLGSSWRSGRSFARALTDPSTAGELVQQVARDLAVATRTVSDVARAVSDGCGTGR